ncbi:phosphatidylglycerol lysyltransferase [Catalinimonas alkaloidigena]|uniref:Phosphatidylglycerol lysyltransferase n=1 Tax=Catalinimonas alkaloidigena TaxID=1075417 RepID=A0A1G9S3I0_9BACT|nr:phosphatidylglycerol lysyltransferase domain-containing protein [Catalinimonas alkaloidigena]SDM29830.1 phosphatidylglycerol lysyltransferase [Catalinimonas alkaloidigena]
MATAIQLVQRVTEKLPPVRVSGRVGQILLALVGLVFALFFIHSEWHEVGQTRTLLRHADAGWIAVGLLLTGGYLLLQALMYVFSFRALGGRVSVGASLVVFLKRNLLSVFLPAGGFASLAFFTQPLKREGVTRTQIHVASSLYGLCGLVSVVVVAVPALGWTLWQGELNVTEIAAFAFLVSLTVGLGGGLYSLWQQGRVYQWLVQLRPSLTVAFDELRAQQIGASAFLAALGMSVLIEGIGMAHVYVAAHALGLALPFAAAVLGYVVMVMLLIASPFLRGLGAIEVSMTYLFTQYGLSTAEAVSVTLLFRLLEFWLPLLAGVFSFVARRDHLLVRVWPALVMLTLGVINVVSAATPALATRLHLLTQWVLPSVIHTSKGLVLVSGLWLMVLSAYLLVGTRRAWITAVLLTSLSLVGHLLKGIDWEEATLAGLSLITLGVARSAYRLRASRRSTRLGLATFVGALVAVLIYGVLGFYWMDARHFGIAFTWQQAIAATFRLFFLFDSSGLTPRTSFAATFLTSLYVGGAAVVLFVSYHLWRPWAGSPPDDSDEQQRAERFVETYGHASLDYFKTYLDKNYWFSEDAQALVAYRVAHHYAVVLENPVVAPTKSLRAAVEEFDQWCREQGQASFYYRVNEEDLPVYEALRKRALPIGQEAVVDLTQFTLEGGAMKSLRNALKKVEKEGYTLRVYPPPLAGGTLQRLRQVSDEWLRSNARQEVGFTDGWFDEGKLRVCTVLAVENAEQKIVAFLNLIPDRAFGEATYDLIRRTDDAPNGALDFLLVHLFLYLKEKGVRQCNLGLAPLAGLETAEGLPGRTLRFAYEHLPRFEGFHGLRHFKDKFQPVWKTKYLIYDQDFDLLRVPSVLTRVSRTTDSVTVGA